MADMDGRGRGCAEVEPEISALLDGELAAPEAAAAEAHLRACPACSALARDLSSVSRTLRALDAEEPPVVVSAGFRARVLAGAGPARRRRTAASAPAEIPLPRWFPWIPAAAAAASVIAVGAAGSILWSHAEGWISPPEVASSKAAAVDAGSVMALLSEANLQREAGRNDLERRAVLSAFGLEPGCPEVRKAFERTMGFDPSALDRRMEETAAAVPGGVTRIPGLTAGPEEGSPTLWIGPWKFSSPGAYDDFLSFREKSHEMEIALAAREVALASETSTVARVNEPRRRTDPVAEFLGSLRVGDPFGGAGSDSVAYQGIVVYPLRPVALPGMGGIPAPPDDILSLPEAMESRRAEVLDSPGKGGRTVLVTNHDPERSILVLAGEVIQGGRGDRMVARDALVPAGARSVPVPVYEVSVGRASSRSYGTRFRVLAGTGGARLRGLAVGQASPADLADFIRGRLDLLSVTSSRRSLADAFSDRGPAAPVVRATRPEAADLTRALVEDPMVMGFAVAQGRDLLAVEVFGSHALMASHARLLLEGCALEASTYAVGGRHPAPSRVAAMLEAAGRGASFRDARGALTASTLAEGAFPEVGVLAIEGGLLGSGVVRGDAVLHAVIFRGAGSGAIAGRGARSGDLPGGGAPAPADSSSEEAGDGPEGSGGSDAGPKGPATKAGEDESRPAEGSPATDRPR